MPNRSISLAITAVLCIASGRGGAETAFLADPVSVTASSFFNANYGPGNLTDASAAPADLGTTFPAGTTMQYAGVGAGPHVVVYEYGSPVTFRGLAYSQRAGSDQALDKVTSIDVWVSDTDPGPAATNMPILSDPVDGNTGPLHTADTTFLNYDLGDELTGQWVVLRLNDTGGNVGNPGGSELQLSYELPPADPDLVLLSGGRDLGTVEMDEPTLRDQVPVVNEGATQPLIISDLTFVGPDAGNFAYAALPEPIAPGATGEILVDFTPGSELRIYTATMIIHSNDPNAATTPLELTVRVTPSVPDALELLPDPDAITASTFFNASYAPEFLYDAALTIEDIETLAFLPTDPQYAGQGVGPHVLVLDYGAAVSFDSFVYAQRIGGVTGLDKVPGMEFWVTGTDPGPAALDLAVLSEPAHASRNGLNTSDGILHYYELGTTLTGRYVVIRLQAGNGNTGSSELHLTLSAPLVELAITSITGLGGGVWELTIAGKADAGYEFRSSPVLDFSPGLLVGNLTQGDPGNDPGTIAGTNGSVLITDSNGDGKVQMTLGSPADFVRAQVPPPVTVFEEDFDHGVTPPAWPAGWDVDPIVGDTIWERGAPTLVGPPAASSGTYCVGTNLDAVYGLNADTWFRTPPINLTTSTAGTLSFRQFREIEYVPGVDFDFGSIRIVAADDLAEIAVLESAVEGNDTEWRTYSAPLPAGAFAEPIRIEFRFQSDEFVNLAGWYIDDVTVTVPGF